MFKALFALILFFPLLFVYTKLAGPFPFSVTSTTTTKNESFTVQGEGKALVKPDIARVSVGVTSNGATVKEAQNQLNASINKVSDAIKKLDIESKDVQTTNYSIYPQSDYRQGGVPKIIGYQANTNLSIVVRNIDKANDVLDAATANGANQIGGISFDVDDKTKPQNEARVKAVAEAKKKAQMAAQTAGFRLGKIVNYSEDVGGIPRPPYLGIAKTADSVASRATNVEVGSSEITVTVNLSYEIF